MWLREQAEAARVDLPSADQEKMWQRVQARIPTSSAVWDWKQWAVAALTAGALLIGARFTASPQPAQPVIPSQTLSLILMDAASETVSPPSEPSASSASHAPKTDAAHAAEDPKTPLEPLPVARRDAIRRHTPTPPAVTPPAPNVWQEDRTVCEGVHTWPIPPEVGTVLSASLNGRPLKTDGGKVKLRLRPGRYRLVVKGTAGEWICRIEAAARPDAAFEFTVALDGRLMVEAPEPVGREWWRWDQQERAPEEIRTDFIAPAGIHEIRRVVESPQGCRDTAVRLVKRPLSHTVRIPNVITPDGDGRNDTWQIEVSPQPTSFEVRVVTADGRTVFRHHALPVQWDGTCGDRRCPPETYFYVVRLRFSDEQQSRTYSGTITIKY